MKDLLSKITIRVNEHTYLKDPESSDLGKKILGGSINLIHREGFEQLTFKKLAHEIQSTEASVYRYFESKHKLLLYLVNWYWGWLEYRLIFSTANVDDAKDRLKRAIKTLTEDVKTDSTFEHINEIRLHQIVIQESTKAYLTRQVDDENKEGAFIAYKQLVARVSDIVKEINPNYPYPHMLISTVMEGSHIQRFFADHLPRLTDSRDGEDSIVTCFTQMVLKSIQ